MRNSETSYNYEQTAVFVLCREGGSFYNHEQITAFVPVVKGDHEIIQFDGIRKLDVLFLVVSNGSLSFLLPISQNPSETPNFSATKTNTALNFPNLERHILVWNAFPWCMVLF